MKVIKVTAFVIVLMLILSACGQSPTENEETKKEDTTVNTMIDTTARPESTMPETGAKTEADFLEFMPIQGVHGPHIENFCNVTKLTGMPTTARSVWGGNQNRLVCDGESVYFAYFTSGEYADRFMDFALFRFSDKKWTHLGSDTCSGDAAIPLVNADGRIFVASSGDNRPQGAKKTYAVWEYDKENDTLVRYLYNKSAGLFNYNYYAACIDKESGIIYMLFCGGDPVDVLAYNTFDTNTKEFGSPRVIELDYRHCYIYMQPDGKGGLTLQGGRDVVGSILGYAPKPDGEFPYVFDGVRFWHISDTESGIPDVDIVIRAENPADYAGETNYPTVMNNYTGDCFQTSDGKFHVLYSVTAKSTEMRSKTFYAIIENGQIIRDELLWDGAFSLRMLQDGSGELWLLKMAYGSNELALYKGDGTGQGFVFYCSFELPTDAPLSYAGLYLAAPRGGTEIYDFADIVYPTGEDTWNYFRLYFN